MFPADRPDGTVAKAAYVFCVLEQFHQRLKRRDIFAGVSARWGDPRAQLLDGQAWANAKGPALNALRLPEEPRDLLAGHAAALDEAWRQVAAGLAAGHGRRASTTRAGCTREGHRGAGPAEPDRPASAGGGDAAARSTCPS